MNFIILFDKINDLKSFLQFHGTDPTIRMINFTDTHIMGIYSVVIYYIEK